MENTVELRIELEKTVFSLGEPVKMALVVINNTPAEIILRFRSAQKYDYNITDSDGLEIRRWSRGRMFAMVLTSLTLPPGESKRFETAWDQIDDNGNPVPPGHYTISVWLTTQNAFAPKPASVTIHIQP